jgi:UDP-N-acetyl-D-glucosamine dehydrogenase
MADSDASPANEERSADPKDSRGSGRAADSDKAFREAGSRDGSHGGNGAAAETDGLPLGEGGTEAASSLAAAAADGSHSVSLSGAARALAEKIEEGTATIGVVGLGYVGLPLAVEYAKKGFAVQGIDLSEERVEKLREGRNYIDDVDDDEVEHAVREDRLTAHTDFAAADEADVVFICVPTPVTPHKAPDTSYIEAATEALAEHLREGQLFILRSTTYPNTTDELVRPRLEEAAAEDDLALGRDFFLAFSPERIDPGNEQFTAANTPVVVGGVTEACTELVARASKQIVAQVHRVSSPTVAEMEKLLENTFRSVNIALVNELARLCDRIGGVSMWEVVEAAASKPFGFMPFYPGPGLGGHCIPVDPYYLSWLAREYDFETSFITLSARINEEMPHYVVDAVVQAVAEQPVRLSEAKVLVLGAAFKKNVDDTRHSPAETVIRLLHEHGVEHVQYSDPHVPTFEAPASGGGTERLEATPLTKETLAEHDVSIVLTDHSAFPYAQIAKHARAVVDTRNALGHVPHNRDKITVLGGGDF